VVGAKRCPWGRDEAEKSGMSRVGPYNSDNVITMPTNRVPPFTHLDVRQRLSWLLLQTVHIHLDNYDEMKIENRTFVVSGG